MTADPELFDPVIPRGITSCVKFIFLYSQRRNITFGKRLFKRTPENKLSQEIYNISTINQ